MISEILRTMQEFDLVRHRCCGRLGGFASSIRGFRKVISSVYIFQKLHACLSWNIVLTKPLGFRHMKDSDRAQTVKWRERPIILPKCCICLHAYHAHLVPKIMTFSKKHSLQEPISSLPLFEPFAYIDWRMVHLKIQLCFMDVVLSLCVNARNQSHVLLQWPLSAAFFRSRSSSSLSKLLFAPRLP